MNIPAQIEGKETNNSAHREFPNVEDAKTHFDLVAARLLNVNEWKNISGPQSAGFDVYNSDGQPVERLVQVGDYIRINIPGPGLTTGDGFDWVTVIDIQKSASAEEGGDELADDVQQVGMTVRPADNPLNDSPETAHFFESSATSTFLVMRTGSKIEASVHGRNEQPNKDVSPKLDKVRNQLVAATASAMFSGIQWQSLTNGLVGTGSK